MVVPLIFRASDDVAGIEISKAYKSSKFVIVQTGADKRKQVFMGDFEKLLRLMWKIRIAEKKEKNKRVLAGIDD